MKRKGCADALTGNELDYLAMHLLNSGTNINAVAKFVRSAKCVKIAPMKKFKAGRKP